MTPDLLNFKKGWMSMLDKHGEWRKHWFVLTDASLRYYRDSDAEERDDPDGEIDLQYCAKVSEFDVDKNFGFQIHTREAVFTLSAVTSGIRRNWVEVLRKSALPSISSDITQMADSSTDKENPPYRPLPSPRRRSLRQTHGDPPEMSVAAPALCDYAELAPHSSPSANEEEEEGCSREQHRRLESRTRWFQTETCKKDSSGSPWDTVVLKRGNSPASPISPTFPTNPTPPASPKSTTFPTNPALPASLTPPAFQSEEDIERTWVEFERLLLTGTELPSQIISLGDPTANQTLQKEGASLRQQLVSLQGDGGGGGESGHCGPQAPCGRSLEAMERAHRQALEELQKQHEREMRELEREKDRLLREETQATAQAMEALKKAHKEELEQELESVRRQAGGSTDTQTLHREQRSETQALQRELDSLSDRYSHKCLELNRAEQSSGEREREISRMEREMGQLRKENQELQALSSSELEMLLRVKENELQYLHREISCLRDELHSLNKEKRSACDRYKEVYVELSRMKSRSEQEIEALKEHLKLAMAALQEGQELENSLEH
ncbi:hypothetical protein AGOR_G00198950 [Albula goreensis]|uniref:PH domain-containing protein n=1 Tax=Albula goreensis TaxID=1534307 RepID=A0A8T3CNP0_9TELE|nr:hypothetical protein AGOR_G00198950 [Albula goreensis]